jgi:hypothetical protein
MLHSCYHWRNEVSIGPYKVLASSFHALFSKQLKAGSSLIPTWGIYLDEGWKEVETGYPKMVVDWPDCGIIELSALKSLVQMTKEKLKAGEIIDIACYLGHGRAGTLLACLISEIEALTPDAAIFQLRQRYCDYAVEYREQVKLVHDFSGVKVADQRTSRTLGSLNIG